MATLSLTATCRLSTTINGYSGFIWCTTNHIQTYLDANSVIDLGDGASDTYAMADAYQMENDVVYEIMNYLSKSLTLSIYAPAKVLVTAAAKLTAAAIGQARMGASMGNELTPWTHRLANSAWSRLQIIFIFQQLDNAVAKDVPLWQRLLLAKMRERSIVPNV